MQRSKWQSNVIARFCTKGFAVVHSMHVLLSVWDALALKSLF